MSKYKTTRKKQKILVCTAWPYVHDLPHLGNFLQILSGDAITRYYKSRGYETIYVSGSDSHGARMEYEATKRGTTPKKLVYDNHKQLKKIIEEFNVEFDNYTITHNTTHQEFVKRFYEKLEKNGYITKHEEKQVYCKDCEKFLADRFVQGTCPHCKKEGARGNQCETCGRILNPEELIKPHCCICNGKNIIQKETTHWYFNLPKIEPKIEKWFNTKKWTGTVKNYTARWFKEGLKERTITRDLKWGIQAPFKGAEKKVIYVWAEAVLGYVSAVKELYKGNRKWLKYWQEENVKQIHTIGKDNIPFHTIILPGLLSANNEKWHLPDQVLTTEFLNWEEGKKFSKTEKRGLFVGEALQILPAQYWRFYLLSNRPETRDVNFSWVELEKSINAELIGNIGNLVNRTLTLIHRHHPKGLKKPTLNAEDKKLIAKIKSTGLTIEKEIEITGSLKNALKTILELSSKTNTYFQKREPWKNEKLRENTLYTSYQIVKTLSVYLQPFTPSITKKLKKIIGKQDWNSITKLESIIKIKKPEILIKKIDVEKIKKEYEQFKKKKGKNMIRYEDFSKLEIKIGTIKKVEEVNGADKLYKITVNTGKDRVIVSGIKQEYTIKELLGKQIVVLTNLEPKKLRGIESQGMLLATEINGKAVLLQPDKNVKEGSEIC
ncbi:MAG: methionine--tRNA ligase [Nanoarchaeota archaeon]|nr:methionine--tRNA ligase [Nanoarchaeota archaeon]